MSLPRIIQVVQCTAPPMNRWYEECIGIQFAVIDSTRDYYFVEEYLITPTMCIPLLIKKADCKIIER